MSQTDESVPAGGDEPAVPMAEGGGEVRKGGPPAMPARLGRGIGLKLLAAIFLFSTAVTLLTTLFELYVDYRGQIQDIRDHFDDIKAGYLASLGGSLWSLDVDQIKLQIEGIKRLPDMQYLEVREVGRNVRRRVLVSVGERGDGGVLTQEYPIVYAGNKERGAEQTIGILYVEATLSGVYHRLIDKAVTILISQGIKTFLVSISSSNYGTKGDSQGGKSLTQ